MAKKQAVTLQSLDKKLDRVIDAMATHQDIQRMDKRIDDLEAKFEKRFHDVMVAIDNLAKAVHDLTLEYAAVKTQLARHEEWIKLLAKKNGIKLPM